MYYLTELLIGLATLYAIVYSYFYFGYKYWEKRKFPFIPPKFPLGNSEKLIRSSKNFNLETINFYNEVKSKGWKFGGVYTILRPVLVVIDPDYIKDILSKDFQHFTDRGFYYNKKSDPASCHLFAMDGSDWRNMRVRLTPTFTSSKMKMMFPNILKISERTVTFLEKSAGNQTDIGIREVLACFGTDVIVSCAFGIENNSYENPDFKTVARNVVSVRDWMHVINLIIIANAPKLGRALGLKGMRSDITEFCTNVINKTIKYREETGIQRPDFLQLLIEMKNKNEISGQELIAEVIVFLVAGFDTSTTTMTFSLYELSRNQELQNKARDEINKVLEKHGGEITYENLKEMTYLQQVVDEAQRLYPPLTNLQRMCVKDYRLRDSDLIVEKGTQIVIPITSLQRDPDHYPDPERFDPERFSAENKSKRHPFLHLPFGEGPRNCIGLRFGLMQSKIGLIQILRNYRLTISKSTQMPLTLNPEFGLLVSNETLYLNAEKIQ